MIHLTEIGRQGVEHSSFELRLLCMKNSVQQIQNRLSGSFRLSRLGHFNQYHSKVMSEECSRRTAPFRWRLRLRERVLMSSEIACSDRISFLKKAIGRGLREAKDAAPYQDSIQHLKGTVTDWPFLITADVCDCCRKENTAGSKRRQ